MSIERVISGGQTGADQAGWRAAKAAGLATGGWMPKGYLTEAWPRPDFAALYGAVEHASAEYPAHTEANVRNSDITIWFGDQTSRGGRLTLLKCEQRSQGAVVVERYDPTRAASVARWIKASGARVLNVAGNRESDAPGIGEWTERFLGEVFAILFASRPSK